MTSLEISPISPSLVETKRQRFLITDAPSDSNISKYVDVMKKKNVTYVVRACSPTYSTELLEAAGIKVLEMAFKDGDPPPNELVDKWLDLVEQEFANNDKATIAVHCVAGLGRAPCLVAIALIEDGMEPHEAIQLIRKRRRGAINSKQLKYLESYKRRKVSGCGCTIL